MRVEGIRHQLRRGGSVKAQEMEVSVRRGGGGCVKDEGGGGDFLFLH